MSIYNMFLKLFKLCKHRLTFLLEETLSCSLIQLLTTLKYICKYISYYLFLCVKRLNKLLIYSIKLKSVFKIRFSKLFRKVIYNYRSLNSF